MLVRLLCFALTALAMLLLGSAQAAAQAWLTDRARAEGRGIRLGDFELHPGIGAEMGYDSNLFLSEDPDGGTAILRVTPQIYLSTLGQERLQGETPTLSFRTGVGAAFKYFFAPAESDIGLGQDARLVWTPSSVFALELFDDFRRTVDPFTEPAGPLTGDTSQLVYERDQLGVGTRLQLSTPGGLLKAGLGYRFDLDYFESELFAANTNYAHSITADTSWEFLPKTAVFWNGALQFHEFAEQDGVVISERNDSTRVRSKLGLNGALTPRIGFTLAGGYGAGFFEDESDYESVIAQIEARWRLRETVLWALGYDREFSTAFQGNFARMDRIKTRLQAMLGGAFLLGARAELTFVDFGRDDRLADPERDDIHLLTNLNGEYRFTDWFAVTAEFGYLRNFTDYVYVIDDPADPGPPFVDGAEYERFEAWLGVRAFL